MYTSFIGNLKYNYVDPVAASIEIGRRELFRFEKNKFYPPLEDTIIDNLNAEICKECEKNKCYPILSVTDEINQYYLCSSDRVIRDFLENSTIYICNISFFYLSLPVIV